MRQKALNYNYVSYLALEHVFSVKGFKAQPEKYNVALEARGVANIAQGMSVLDRL